MQCYREANSPELSEPGQREILAEWVTLEAIVCEYTAKIGVATSGLCAGSVAGAGVFCTSPAAPPRRGC